jgi:hypothetical protein
METSEARKRREDKEKAVMSKAEIIKGLDRFIPFELGDDPAAWRQKDTVERIAAYLQTVLKDEVN